MINSQECVQEPPPLFLRTMWRQRRGFTAPSNHPFILPPSRAPRKPRNTVGISLMSTPKSRVKIPHSLFSSLLLAEYIAEGTPRLQNRTTCHCLRSTIVPFSWLQKHHKHWLYWKGLSGCKRWQLLAGRRINVSKCQGKREGKREIQ